MSVPSQPSLIKKIVDAMIAERLRDAERIRRPQPEPPSARRARADDGTLNTRTAPADRELVDRLMELYCDWRTRCAEVQAAYERFCKASARDRAAAFGAYIAALDREESTCTSYAAQVRTIQSRYGVGAAGAVETRSKASIRIMEKDADD